MSTATRSARVLLVVVAASVVTAWRLGWTELWAVAAAVAAILVLAKLSTLVVPPIRARRVAPPLRGTVGEDLALDIVVANGGRRRQRPRRVVDHLGGHEVEVALPSLPPRSETRLGYRIRAVTRGRVRLGPLRAGVGDGLGLFDAHADLTPTTTVLVRPRSHPLHLEVGGRRRDDDGVRSELAEGTTAFHTLREYVPGDDIRRVHWRSSARTGSLVVRLDVDPTEPRTLILVDPSDAAWSTGTLEDGIEVAASVAVAAHDRGSTVQLIRSPEGDVVESREAGAVLDALATFTTRAGDSVWVPEARTSSERPGLALAVTGTADAGDLLVDRLVPVADEVVVVVVSTEADAGITSPVADGHLVRATNARQAVALLGGLR